MKIVVLDGYAMNPGDLPWDELQKLGDCKIYDRTSSDQIISRSIDAEIIVLNKVRLDGDTLKQLPKLKYICVMAIGYNVIDVQTARSLNIDVANIPTYCVDSVAQMVFAHILNLSLHAADHSETVKEGKWCNSLDFAYWTSPLIELAGLTLGLVGFGNIARAVAKIADSFNMKVIAYKPSHSDNLPEYVDMVDDVTKIFELSDIVSLHCPLNDKTENLVNENTLSLMKNTSFLINTGRGGLIDETALAKALNSGRIAGAGVDVLSTEPPQKNNPLITVKNCYITPHIAWATIAARKRLMKTTIENVQSLINGNPQNIVN